MSESYVKGLREQLQIANRELIACEASHDDWKARAEKAEAELKDLAAAYRAQEARRLKAEEALREIEQFYDMHREQRGCAMAMWNIARAALSNSEAMS